MRLKAFSMRLGARFAATLVFVLGIGTQGLFAWDDHGQLSARSLATQDWAGQEVQAESLDDFLAATKLELAKLLTAVEAKAKKDYSSYRPLPASLVFDPSAEGPALRSSFIGAIRVNPNMPFPLFLQVPVGGDRKGRPDLALNAVSLGELRLPNGPFISLAPGERATAIEVVESACDEPDYGMDFGLYEDNGTDWGSRYGFGIQPWGNPKLSYGTQAPFHMSFDNEPGILHSLAKWTTESNSGYRIDLYSALARFAFATGHDYWGWRFAGWALHYVQDLTQPYHASIMPSKTTFALIWMNAFGSKATKDGAVTLLSNRHLIFEDYQYELMAHWTGDPAANPAYAALVGSDGVDSRLPPPPKDFSAKAWAIEIVAAQSRARGRELDRAIVATFPAKYVSDPSFDYGAWQSETKSAYDPLAELLAQDPTKAQAFDLVLAKSLRETGEASRLFMQSLAADLPR
ncbi:MAG TPA: hypothetical protein VMV44_04425 [Rectinemataceae bacterium]|nr:hypothetical protein [Rectinemataceae bacterium]